MTKKLKKQSGISSLIASLVLAVIIGGLLYWDYREQKNFYNIFGRGVSIDFKTGKPIPNYQPPPFEYRVGKSGLLPVLLIMGAVGLFVFGLSITEFVQAAKTHETQEMIAEDMSRETIQNSPEMKRYSRDRLILQLAPFVLLAPVPFIAVYKLGIYVFLVYIIFVAIVIGTLYVYLPRQK